MEIGKIAYYYLAGVTALVLAGGTVFYHLVEELPWIDAYYFCVITLTTVGYGDISPQTNAGKLFTTLYLMIGIGIITGFITVTAKRSGQKLAKRRQEHDDKSK